MISLKKQILSTFFTFLGILSLSNGNAQDLNKHRWQNRILIIQSSEKASPKYQQQLREFTESNKALAERKLVFYELIKDQYKMTDFQESQSVSSWKNTRIGFTKIRVGKDSFKVTLIGLDGGIKLEQSSVLKKEELFRIIDSMPMRMQEMRSKMKRKGA